MRLPSTASAGPSTTRSGNVYKRWRDVNVEGWRGVEMEGSGLGHGVRMTGTSH